MYLCNGQDLTGWAITLEKPETEVFCVKEGVMHVAGMPFGYARTQKAYKNYKLTDAKGTRTQRGRGSF